jgi:hypothetical protein
MPVDSYSVQLIASLLDGATTIVPTPGTAQTGSVLEAFGGLPQRVGAGVSDLNIKLGTLTNPLWLAIWGAEGITFNTTLTGSEIDADPFAFLADETNGLGISEIWVSNSSGQEQSITILAAE